MKKSLTLGIFSSAGMLMLILDSRTALQGAQEGIDLCLRAVIPSLFPFLVLGSILTSATGRGSRLLRPLGRLLYIPKGAEGVFLTGILGGYPTGARVVTQAYQSGQLPKNEANRMLTFCNNAGPAFLFGILSTKFAHWTTIWVLWGIHILSAMVVARLQSPRAHEHNVKLEVPPISLAQALKQAVSTMGCICGWVVLFRIFLCFCSKWILWIVPTPVQIAFSGLVELTNGCCELDAITSESTRFVLCSALLAFGGICVTMQTASVIGALSLGAYFRGKVVQTAISAVLALIVSGILFPSDLYATQSAFVGLILGASGLVFRRLQKRSSIPAKVGV